jgi:hypothetical protein
MSHLSAFLSADLNHVVGAGFNTVAASGAGFLVNQHNPGCFRPADRVKGAGVHAEGVFALGADQRPVNQVFVFTENFQAGQARTIAADTARLEQASRQAPQPVHKSNSPLK